MNEWVNEWMTEWTTYRWTYHRPLWLQLTSNALKTKSRFCFILFNLLRYRELAQLCFISPFTYSFLFIPILHCHPPFSTTGILINLSIPFFLVCSFAKCVLLCVFLIYVSGIVLYVFFSSYFLLSHMHPFILLVVYLICCWWLSPGHLHLSHTQTHTCTHTHCNVCN